MQTTEQANRAEETPAEQPTDALLSRLHPAWRALIRYCQEMRYGEIERIKIQDGLPVMAEVTTKKIKFGA